MEIAMEFLYKKVNLWHSWLPYSLDLLPIHPEPPLVAYLSSSFSTQLALTHLPVNVLHSQINH